MPLHLKDMHYVEVYECDVCDHQEEYSVDMDDPDPWGKEHGESPPSQCPNCDEKEAEKEAKNSHRETNSNSI